MSRDSKGNLKGTQYFHDTKILESWSFGGLWTAYAENMKEGKIDSGDRWETSAETNIQYSKSTGYRGQIGKGGRQAVNQVFIQ